MYGNGLQTVLQMLWKRKGKAQQGIHWFVGPFTSPFVPSFLFVFALVDWSVGSFVRYFAIIERGETGPEL